MQGREAEDPTVGGTTGHRGAGTGSGREEVIALGDRQDAGHRREGGVKDDPSRCRCSLDRQILPRK